MQSESSVSMVFARGVKALLILLPQNLPSPCPEMKLNRGISGRPAIILELKVASSLSGFQGELAVRVSDFYPGLGRYDRRTALEILLLQLSLLGE